MCQFVATTARTADRAFAATCTTIPYMNARILSHLAWLPFVLTWFCFICYWIASYCFLETKYFKCLTASWHTYRRSIYRYHTWVSDFCLCGRTESIWSWCEFLPNLTRPTGKSRKINTNGIQLRQTSSIYGQNGLNLRRIVLHSTNAPLLTKWQQTAVQHTQFYCIWYWYETCSSTKGFFLFRFLQVGIAGCWPKFEWSQKQKQTKKIILFKIDIDANIHHSL